MVMEVVHEEDSMQCTDHPYKSSSTPGGICAFCLQEKLGKLVSSSFPAAVFPSSSSSSSPSFRSDFGSNSLTLKDPYLASSSATSQTRQRVVRLPFMNKKEKRDEVVKVEDSDSDSTTNFFITSKSTKTPGRRSMHFLDENYAEDNSPQRRSFWSFLYLSKLHSAVVSKKGDRDLKDSNFTSATPSTVSSTVGSSSVSGAGVAVRLKEKQSEGGFVMVDENESSDEASFDRKVSRSRSVGCGSRSFSNDLFGRISTGFGDCTLRRVESQREEGKQQKVHSLYKNDGNIGQEDGIKERVRCGGIFSGFMINSSSSSSSSSYWIASAVHDGSKSHSMGHIGHTRSRSWGWVLASPMRAFGKTPTTRKREVSSSKNSTPNLYAIPSLLTVHG